MNPFLLLKSRKPNILVQMVFSQLFHPRINKIASVKPYFENKLGIEIGGPSNIFKNWNIIPIYKLASQVDGCNFSNQTAWEGKIESGNTYQYSKEKKGLSIYL